MDMESEHPSIEIDTVWQNGKSRSKASASKRKACSLMEREEEKLIRREKNRIAARDSRARKVQCLSNLQQDMEALRKANAVMEKQLDQVQAKATAAQSSRKVLKEEIQQCNEAWTPAERQVLACILDHITALSGEQRAVSAVLQKPIQAIDTGPNPKASSKSSTDSFGRSTKASETGQKRSNGGGISMLTISSNKVDVGLQSDGEPGKDEDPFGLGSPLIGGLHNSLVPLDAPLGWLFY